MANIYEKLLNVQAEVKAPKKQFNNFGKYNYRSCEDVLVAIKPLLLKNNLVITISDFVVNIGGKNYVESTAILIDVENPTDRLTVKASARESEVKKGMDDSQITGSTSSYARKYALNGLFAIDDTEDADTMDNTTINNSELICKYCSKEIKAVTGKDNKYYTAKEISNKTGGYCSSECKNKQ